MTAITEDYVSFEVAKLLKEKGMDTTCFNHYIPKHNDDGTSEAVTVCTLQMTMKWLRQVHNLHIITIPYAPIDRPPYHPGETDFVYIAQIFRGIILIDAVGRSIIKLSPEEACEAAIKYCLENLI